MYPLLVIMNILSRDCCLKNLIFGHVPTLCHQFPVIKLALAQIAYTVKQVERISSLSLLPIFPFSKVSALTHRVQNGVNETCFGIHSSCACETKVFPQTLYRPHSISAKQVKYLWCLN